MDRRLQIILVIVLFVVLLGLMPVWPYASNWRMGWYPSGGVGLLVIVLVLFAVLGGRDSPSLR